MVIRSTCQRLRSETAHTTICVSVVRQSLITQAKFPIRNCTLAQATAYTVSHQRYLLAKLKHYA